MSAEGDRLLATYRTTFAALEAERVLLARGARAELIPVPRGISSDCGFCLLVEPRGEGEGEIDLIRLTSPAGLWRVREADRAGAGKEKRYESIPNDG